MKTASIYIKSLKKYNINTWVLFYLSVYLVLILKLITIRQLDDSLFFSAYSLLVSLYILSRFLLAYFYDPDIKYSNKYQPSISFAVPAKNEGDNIRQTLAKIAKTNYPKDKFDIIAINDGSTDDTLQQMKLAKKEAQKMGIKVLVVNWKINRGKREGMAECVRRSNKDIIIYIDSDSFVKPNTAKELIKYFSDDSIAAVAGHTYVANADVNYLTKMQSVRYFVAYKAFKASEALFGTVTCCSGCCSAYRRIYITEILDQWLKQSFLGVRCTYGDDRSLTNFVLRNGYKTVFSPSAIAYTFVPETFSQFMKQQLRWKKSWLRENFIASKFMWKRNLITSISFYTGVILPLLAPVVVIRAFFWYPLVTHNAPFYYLTGLIIMAIVYGLYYRLYIKDSRWIYGVLFATFYTLVLMWQLPWAMLNIRDSRWGTR